MDQVRMFLAIALSFLVFFLWNIFFVEKEGPGKVEENVSVTQKDNMEAAGHGTIEPKKALGLWRNDGPHIRLDNDDSCIYNSSLSTHFFYNSKTYRFNIYFHNTTNYCRFFVHFKALNSQAET